MKLLNLHLLLVTLCLTLINALNVNDIPIPANNLFIADYGIGAPDVYIKTCSYNQERERIYCTFKDKKYIDKGLYVMIPVDPRGEFRNNSVIKSWNVISCLEGRECNNVSEIGCMSLWEKVEAGDTYSSYCGYGVFPEFFFKAVLSDNSTVHLKYNTIYVNEYK